MGWHFLTETGEMPWVFSLKEGKFSNRSGLMLPSTDSLVLRAEALNLLISGLAPNPRPFPDWAGELGTGFEPPAFPVA